MARMVYPTRGVIIAAVLIGLSGLSSFVEGWELLRIGEIGPAILAVAIGSLLLYRGYGIWTLNLASYAIELALLAIRALLALVVVLTTPFTAEAGISLVLVAAALLYLVQPEVRAQFRHGGS